MPEKSHVNQNSAALLNEYCKDINEWPGKWEIDSADIATGKSIVEQFKLFLVNRIEKGRTRKTIRMYCTYLWALGGELIRQVNEDEDERRLSARNLIFKYVDDSGGPYWRHACSDENHARYDPVCKQLFKFMLEKSKN
jgi:hypothetical protein